MKSFSVKMLERILRMFARLTIRRFQPTIIGVTGSVGKTSAKRAITVVLSEKYRVRAASGNLNSELGLPLAILGGVSSYALVTRDTPFGTKRGAKLWFWLKVIAKAKIQLFFGKTSSYPEMLVLEYGVDHPGDMEYLLSVARPDIGVLTGMGKVPAHVEFFESPEGVAEEKAKLVRALSPKKGILVVNADDERAEFFKTQNETKVLSYGFEEGVSVRVTDFDYVVERERPRGITFKLEHEGNVVPVRMDGTLGRPPAYAAAAAACVGIHFGVNLLEVADAFSGFLPAPHRMEIVERGGITIIDDSYNANPLSMKEALDALRALPAKRKVVVLGDMCEIGEYAHDEHRKVGQQAGEIADVLVVVGEWRELLAEGAFSAGMKKSSIFSFKNQKEASKKIEEILQEGDVVLVKASWDVGLWRMVEKLK